MKRIFRWIEKNEGLVFILAVALLLRVPTLFEPNRYADEDIYLVIGQGLRKGLTLYRDIHDNKPPLIYLLAAIAGNVTGFRLILAIWNIVNIGLMWFLAKKILRKSAGVIVVTGLFAILGNIPLLEGNLANGEIFMILPVTGAILLLVGKKKNEENIPDYLAVGVLMALGFLFKVPVGFDLLAVLLWLTVYQGRSLWEMVKRVFHWRAWIVAVGFVMPIITSIGYYFLVGAGGEYLRAAFGQNLPYLASWEGGQGAFYESGLFQRGMVAGIVTALIVILRGRLGRKFGLIALWIVWSLFGATLSGRPYPHYLLQVVPAGCLLLGLTVETMSYPKDIEKRLIRLIMGLGLFMLIAVGVIRYDFWYYKSLPYYQNFFEFILGRKDIDRYRQFFGEGVERNREVARYIKERTRPEERIFVWGTEPAIYVLSERLPVGRYTVSYHIIDFMGFEETMKQIEGNKPEYIVVMLNERVPFSKLTDYIDANYIEVKRVGEAVIYKEYAL